MANKFQIKRTSVTGRLPEVVDTQSSSYIDQGELAINTADGILYSSDGTNLLEIGSNNTNVSVSDTLFVNKIDASGNVGVDGQFLASNGSAVYWDTPASGGTSSYLIKTSNYTASSGDKIVADTSSGAFTITLPSSPSSGDFVVISDGADFATTNCTVARNGETIEGVADDVLLDVADVKFEFVYNGTTWQVYVSQSELFDVPNVFDTITSDSGNTTANSINDTLSIVGGTDISTSISGDTVTIDYTGTGGITTGKAIAMAIVFG